MPCGAKEPDSVADKYNDAYVGGARGDTMRIIQVLLLIFIMGSLPSVLYAQSVSATMLVTMNVIPACSVNFGDDGSFDNDGDKNIHCGEHNIHRISHHRKHARHHTKFERDNDDTGLTTVEF